MRITPVYWDTVTHRLVKRRASRFVIISLLEMLGDLPAGPPGADGIEGPMGPPGPAGPPGTGGTGSGGATVGTATLDFGAAPGGEVASVNVTTPVGAADMAWASVMYEASADHNAEEHALIAGHLGLTAYRSAANTLTIVARSQLRLTGAVAVRWAHQA